MSGAGAFARPRLPNMRCFAPVAEASGKREVVSIKKGETMRLRLINGATLVRRQDSSPSECCRNPPACAALLAAMRASGGFPVPTRVPTGRQGRHTKSHNGLAAAGVCSQVYMTVCFQNHTATVVAADAMPVAPQSFYECVDVNAGQRCVARQACLCCH